MTLIKWQRGTPVTRNKSVFPTMNDLFNEIFDEMNTESIKRWSTPAVNIIENEKGYKINMAAPGLKKEDFKINMVENVLTINANTTQEKTEENEHYSLKEFSFNSFSRSFNIPESINTKEVTANYENGIMTIQLPKLEVTKQKSWEINVQ